MQVIDHLSPIEVEDMEVPPRPQDPLDLGSRPHRIGEVRPGREADHPIDTRSPERDRDDIGMDPLDPVHLRHLRPRSVEHTPRDIETDHPTLPDRKSTRLNSSHVAISYAVFCLKKKKI